ncbi:site-specific integrase [Anabaena sphaerica FACHB-251]|uniref:Site-specific integrase n=1 Tax=Anabaena sphaerica FACHB-251 TaxID=2692883 RepID=A0A926WKR6_9NOST|nr:site-specific integrase [Anabaena sphaerica]MBD2295256.1 site-specific integrase [Anabaena sphaerica FACHB-251]
MQLQDSKLQKALERANQKLDILKIEVDKSRLRIRCRKRDISFCKYTHASTLDGLEATTAICKEIESDYYRGNFDNTLVKYGLAKESTPKLTEIITLPSEPNLMEIWESYKALKPEPPKSTYNNRWIPVDRWLSECPSECLVISNADRLLAWLRSKYSDGYIHTPLSTIRTAVNLSIKLGKLKSGNPFSTLLSILEVDSRSIQIYSKNEAKTILEAFKDGRFDKDKSAYSSAFYSGYVEFRIRTGCRPSEAIALTWNDIKFGNEKVSIIFNKRYSSGQLLQGTKNGVDARIFPCNKQMIEFLGLLPETPNDNNLVFPSYEGTYIDQHNFHNRYWNPIVNKLFTQKLISKELTFYDLRHSFITWMLRDGVDIKTIATIVGNSPETIMKYYLASNDDIELPEF